MDVSTYVLALLSLVLAFDTASGLMFHLEPNQKKCLKEEIHKDIVVKGEYEVRCIIYLKFVLCYKVLEMLFICIKKLLWNMPYQM